MDVLLGRVTSQAMNYAIRTGLTLTTSYAIQQSQKLLKAAPKSTARDELFVLQQRLEHKTRIISPAIDMIELIAARGNTSLESAIALTKDLRLEIQSLSQRLASAAKESEKIKCLSNGNHPWSVENEREMKQIANDIKKLLERIEDAVPLINLAITTSGVTLSTTLPSTISPSRLLQASTLLASGDIQYQDNPNSAVQIGPTFTLTIYMLFAGHSRPQNEQDIRETTWKEVIHKARVKLRRVPLDLVLATGSGSDALPSHNIKSPLPGPTLDPAGIPADARSHEYAYQLMIIEDFDDDRMHDFEEDQPQPDTFDDVKLAGIREMIPIHQVSKIFYADTSKVLNIGTENETNHPVLLLKRDLNAVPPRRMAEHDDANHEQPEQQCTDPDHAQRTEDPWRLPPSIDPEWVALEVYTEAADSDLDSDTEAATDDTSRVERSPSLDESISRLKIIDTPSSHLPTQQPSWSSQITATVQTNLSLLELLLRLTSLQQFQQQSHLCITDELLNFFLEESASTGAGGDENYRQHVRMEARRRVGWDPYDESPVKKRGEDYQYQGGYPYSSPSPQPYPARGENGAWSPSASMQHSGVQTRSITRVDDSMSPSPSQYSQSPLQGKGRREQWLKKQQGEERKGSPLRPSTARSDEGLGTSPVSHIGSS